MSQTNVLRRRVVAVLAVAAFVCTVAFACVRAAQSMNHPGDVTTREWVFQDFRDGVYYPVVSFLDGHVPYDFEEHSSLYPVLQPCSPYTPLFFLLHVPFGFLPHVGAQILYFFLTIAATLALSYYSIRVCTNRTPRIEHALLLATAILASYPGYRNLLLGQTTIELVFAVYLADVFARRSPWISGCALAFATVKPTFGIPLALLMVAQSRFKAVAIGAIVAAVTTVIPTARLIGSAGGVDEFATTLLSSYASIGDDYTSNPAISAFRIDAVALVTRFAGVSLGISGELAVFVFVTAIAGVALARMRRLEVRNDADSYCLTLVCLAILVASYQQPYSALLLVVPMTALGVNRWRPSWLPAPRWSRFVLIALLSVPALNFGASWRVTSLFEAGSAAWLTVVSINGLALALAFAVYVALALRPVPEERSDSPTHMRASS